MAHPMIEGLRPLLVRVRTDVHTQRPKGRHPFVVHTPITSQVLEHHLNGGPICGAYLLRAGETRTAALILDFDSHDGKTDWPTMQRVVGSVAEALVRQGYAPVVWRSTGGKGCHLYVLFATAQDAAAVRHFGTTILESVGLRAGTKGVAAGEVEVFPKQNKVSEGYFGSMVFLPGGGQSVPLTPGTLEPMALEDWRPEMWVTSRSVPAVQRNSKSNATEIPPPAPRPLDPREMAIVRSALMAIQNDDTLDIIDYERWLAIMFAVHHGTGGSAEGLELMREWGAACPRVASDPTKLDRSWDAASLTREDGVTIRSLFSEARAWGWRLPPALDFADEDFETWVGKVEDERSEEMQRLADWEAAGERDGGGGWVSAEGLTLDDFIAPTCTLLQSYYPDGGRRDAKAGRLWQMGGSSVPPVIEAWASYRSGASGLDVGGYILAGVVVCGASIPLRVRVQEILGDPVSEHSAITWGALIGGPGSGKTPIIKAAIQPLLDHNKVLIRQAQADQDAWTLACSALRPGQSKPPKPGYKCRLMQDATVEALMHTMASDPTGMLHYKDELEGFFEGFNQYKGGKGSDRPIWLSAWNGDPYTQVRIGRGLTHVDRWGPSILGGIQTDRLEHLSIDYTDDGMLPRMMLVSLQKAGACPKGTGSPLAVPAYEKLVQILLGIDHCVCTFAADAQVLFNALKQDAWETAEFFEDGAKLHRRKWGALLCRMALTFHAIKHASGAANPAMFGLPPVIDLDTVQQANDFLEWQMSHQTAFYEMESLSVIEGSMSAIERLILIEGLEQISRRTISRMVKKSGWVKLRKQDQDHIIQALAEAGWLIKAYGVRRNSFSRASKWKVNPEVHILFAKLAADLKLESARKIRSPGRK